MLSCVEGNCGSCQAFLYHGASNWSMIGMFTCRICATSSSGKNDTVKQNWYSEVQNNSQCSFYRKIKDTHQFESYLNELEPVDRYAICKLRTRTHHLPVTKARFQRSNSDSNTFCTLCSLNETGDELHYMFKCPYFLKEQRKYIPEHLLSYNPESAISSILASEYDTLRKFAKFVKIILSTFKYADMPQLKQLGNCQGVRNPSSQDQAGKSSRRQNSICKYLLLFRYLPVYPVSHVRRLHLCVSRSTDGAAPV